jgi:hypothetical protein
MIVTALQNARAVKVINDWLTQRDTHMDIIATPSEFFTSL